MESFRCSPTSLGYFFLSQSSLQTLQYLSLKFYNLVLCKIYIISLLCLLFLFCSYQESITGSQMFRLAPLMKATLHGSQNVCRCMLMYMWKCTCNIGLTTTCFMFLHVCRLFTVFRSLAGGSEDRPTVSVQSFYITKVCK